jgi:hypothetical protein
MNNRYSPYDSSARPQGRYSKRPSPSGRYSRHQEKEQDIGALGGGSGGINTMEKTTPRIFMNDILGRIPGKKEIFYESLKKFGRFKMIDDKIQSDDLFEDPVNSFENLWKYKGYIYVFQRYQHRDHVYMYQVIQESFVKLNERDTKRILENDDILC